MNRDGTGFIATVVTQHAEESTALRNTRSVLVRGAVLPLAQSAPALGAVS